MLDYKFASALLITALLELALHWVPWPRTLPRVVAYTVGVAGILIGCGLWLITTGRRQEFYGIVAICLAAGVGTLVGYGLDKLGNLIVRAGTDDRNLR
jgi:hypothetical protein